MPTTKRAVRLLLEPAAEVEILALMKAEGRSMASVCTRLINSALYQKRLAARDVNKLLAALNGEN